MTGTIGNFILITVVVAVLTALTRGIPFLLFGGKNQVPETVSYLGSVLPASIMVILVIYCLKGIDFSSFPFGSAELISVAVVILAQIIRKNTFLSILIGTGCYMILIRTVFPIGL